MHEQFALVQHKNYLNLHLDTRWYNYPNLTAQHYPIFGHLLVCVHEELYTQALRRGVFVPMFQGRLHYVV
jgi:hypothetical protein